MAPRRGSRPWWLPLLGLIAYLMGLGIALHALGVAGYRAGWLAAALVLAAGGGGLAWRWLGQDFPGRATWIASVVVIGVTASSWLVDHAPLSAARLGQQIDDLQLPFVRVLSERTTGHSSCRPHCPIVEHVYRGPNTTTFKTIFDVAALMRVHGQLADIEPVARRHPQHFLRVRGQRTITEVRADTAPGYIRLTIRVMARRSPVRHPGPIQSDSWTNPRIR